MSDQPSTKTDGAPDPELTLEESIDALLEQVESACNAVENPTPPQAVVLDETGNESDDEFGGGPGEVAERAQPSQTEPDAEASAESGPAVDSAAVPMPDAGEQAEAALEQVELNAEDLLGQAADQLLDDIKTEDPPAGDTDESDAAQVASDPDAAEASDTKADELSVDESLAEAADDLLEDLSFDANDAPARPDAVDEPDTESEPAAVAENVAENGTETPSDADADLLGDAIDGLLNEPDVSDGTSPEDTAEPEPSTEEATERSEDPLDGEAFDALLDGTDVPTSEPAAEPAEEPAASEPEPPQASEPEAADPEPAEPVRADPALAEPEPAREPEPEPQPEPAPAVEPATVAPSDPEPETETAPSAMSESGFVARIGSALRERTPSKVLDAWAWLMPRGAAAAHTSAKVSAPVGARALVLMSKPLEKQPTKVRDSIGWVALWTAFLAVCVWGYLLLRPTEQRLPDANATGIAAIESDAGAAQP